MVEFQTSQAQVQARGAGQVSRKSSSALIRAGQAAQGAANTFTEFYESKAAIENDLILAQAQSDWSANYAERSRGAGSGFAEGMLTDYDSYVSEVMGREGTPQRGRDKLEAAFAEYRIGLEGKALQREAAARAAASAQAQANAQRLRANAIVLDNSLMEESIEGATSEAERSLYLRTGLTARMEEDPQGVLDSVSDGQWNAILTPTQTQSFITHGNNGVAAIQREIETERRVEQASMVDAANEELNFVAATGALPVDSELSDENIDAVFEGNPEGAAELKRVRDNGVMDAENLNVVSHATPQMIEETLLEMQAAVNEPGHTAEDVQRLNSYATALATRNERLAEDGAGYMAQNSEVVSTLFDQYQQQDDPDTQLATANRYANEMAVRYDAMGVPTNMRPLLPKQAADGIVAQFNTMGNDVAAQALKAFKDSWGSNAPQVMAELSRAGLAPEYVTAMRHSDSAGLSAEIVSLAGVTSKELREGLIGVTDADRALDEAVEDYRAVFEAGAANQDAAKLFNENYSIAERLVYSRMRGGANAATAVKDVFSRMFPETVVDQAGAKFLYPDGEGSGLFAGNVTQMLSEGGLESMNLIPFDDPRLPEFTDLAVLKTSLESQGLWVNNSTGDGVSLMIDVGGYLLPIKQANEAGVVSNYEIKFTHNFGLDAQGGYIPGYEGYGEWLANQ